ncbi:S1C family serine protease [uncultured Roseobacter sp.]|uniref:S1C family serine protease n=1 Tax=uncultured Roseobacter sp. TaxID=114847 RepID=UPI0026353A8C|nr:serine protease [uncultured Roseobacter sp.]
MSSMHLILKILLAAFLLFELPVSAKAQDFEALFEDFDAAALTKAEKRFLQAALAFEGHYNGLLDGDWGRISRQAFNDYSLKTLQSSSEDWHMAMLAWSLFQRMENSGWAMTHFASLDLSLLWPENALFRDSDSDNLINYRHTNSSLAISMGRHSDSTAQAMHDYTVGVHAGSNPAYSVRKPSLAVTSASMRNGSMLYARSDFLNGAWSTVLLSANEADVSVLNAVAASITKGRSEPLYFSTGGRLDEVIRKTIAVLEDESIASGQDGSAPKHSNKTPDGSYGGFTGSGFRVSAAGHVLTNAHVVESCRDYTVDGEDAVLTAVSEEFDLALLKVEASELTSVAVFSATSAKLNSDITVVGYPYAGLLGGLNVTRGSVSSLKGLGGEITTMQISAPVQSGNSGGPLLSSDGEVVGVVVSKLNAQKVAAALGDVPQNVNFAIRGEIAKLFLAQHGVDPIVSLSDEELSPEALATLASEFTAFIECN